jgi:hypothetical protein
MCQTGGQAASMGFDDQCLTSHRISMYLVGLMMDGGAKSREFNGPSRLLCLVLIDEWRYVYIRCFVLLFVAVSQVDSLGNILAGYDLLAVRV